MLCVLSRSAFKIHVSRHSKLGIFVKTLVNHKQGELLGVATDVEAEQHADNEAQAAGVRDVLHRVKLTLLKVIH